jgi:hypothetical protein
MPMKREEKIKEINRIVEIYFKKNTDVNKVLAKDLMLDFKKASIFGGKDETGKQLRDLFRKLEKEKQLKQIHALIGEPSGAKTFWYFIRTS